jgi:AcrR family transcriptional regulator
VTITLEKPLKSARKAKGDGHLRRAEILQTAERIFLRDGYQGATIRKIADEVGVSSTALYMHFRDKDEMLLEICSGAIGTLLAVNTEIAQRPVDAVSRVRLMLEAYMRFGFENPNTYWLTFCSPAAGRISAERISAGQCVTASKLGERCHDGFRGAIADVEREGRLRSSVEVAAQVLWSACHGVVALRIGRREIDWAPDDVLISALLDSLFLGQTV